MQIQAQAQIIRLRDRNLAMLKNDLIIRNPLRLMGKTTDDILHEGGFGAVLSRAGVGKTALVVQLALDSMLREKNVLHISLQDPIEKVTLWYRELFQNLTGEYNADQIKDLWNRILPCRFIMTFKIAGFSVPKLEERLADLTEQNIFTPSMIIIDGFSFATSEQSQLLKLKDLAHRTDTRMWFTVHVHRDETFGADGFPLRLAETADLFDVALALKPVGPEIRIEGVKGVDSGIPDTGMILDPATMLLKEGR